MRSRATMHSEIKSTINKARRLLIVPSTQHNELTLMVPNDLLYVLGKLRNISVKELNSSVKPPPFLIESHPRLSQAQTNTKIPS